MEVAALGLGIHVPTMDADLSVPALLAGMLGSRSWMKPLGARTVGGTLRRSLVSAR